MSQKTPPTKVGQPSPKLAVRYVTKLEPEAEKKLRAKISEELKEQALRKAREGA